MNVQEQASLGRVRLQRIDSLTMKSLQLRALLAAIAIACGSGDLPSDHLSNVLWLAGDLARDISEAAIEVLI